MTTNESATARPDETPASVHSLDRAPVVTTMPRLGRGVCWRDIVREIELDELERETRMKEAA
ncbi:DUF6222 family protein [Amycolatopsis regifaucium]|uniref:Uncharacterized protein n=1 Tax=Amycolatopsis regifaucium TaxID=546365 RepID=A0A154MI68_9PSEU|nr:DUF6222 family protein [Amycolatopsis regifaucium]KZB84148.1 hypothetical protein AVL48_34430 [Amycolatopsis regifaucium]OKA08640.1 hypothetical protein ATP06_0211530 [Amycolatopsis regifaucium]SFJ57824.1 hypothetical protein SAMN04489731_12525 [Amycolatopsis regifaucium]